MDALVIWSCFSVTLCQWMDQKQDKTRISSVLAGLTNKGPQQTGWLLREDHILFSVINEWYFLTFSCHGLAFP